MKLTPLRPLYDSCGDYVSVYLDTGRAHEDAQHAIELRWRAAHERLAAEGADPATRVTATKAGGEVLAVTGTGEARQEKAATQSWPVHKTSVGGWAQDWYQRRVEQTWNVNARELASVTAAAAREIGARHIIVAGDIRARTMLLEHLDPPLRQAAAVIDDEVPPASEAVAEAAGQIISARAEQACRERFSQWQEQLSRAAAVEGLADTVAALSEGRVADVFVAGEFSGQLPGDFAGDGPGSAAVWIGPDPADLAMTAARLTERGVGEPVSDRADAAVVRAAAGTDAEVFFLPGDVPALREGIGATLRYPSA